MPDFFDDVIGANFYESVAPTDKQFRFGRLYDTHIYFPHRELAFWRAADTDTTGTTATKFGQKRAVDVKPFDHPTLKSPMLQSNEEYIVLKAKPRPCILIVPPMEDPGVARSAYGAPLTRSTCLVAPIGSWERKGNAKYVEEFENNVRTLRYPELMFLPEKPGAFATDGMVRLDQCQSVLSQNLSPIPFELTKDVKDVLRSQVLYLFDQLDDGYFVEYRAMLS